MRQRWVDLSSRKHFYALAARLMRRVMVDHARSAGAQKRQVPLDGSGSMPPGPTVTELDAALTKLEAFNARMARVVELRFFAGFTAEETAALWRHTRLR